MAITSVRLVDGPRELVLYPREDVNILSLDAPGPDVRVVAQDRPDDDGTIDTTARHGSASVALELQAIAGPRSVEDQIGAYLHPALRPYLVVADDEWAQERRIMLRYETWDPPISADEPPFYRRILLQWRAPDGVWEAAGESQLTVSPDIPSRVGMRFPMRFPLRFAPTRAAGSPTAVNVGNTLAHYVARLYGPITAPRLIHLGTGQQIVFNTALVLGAGEYVEVNTRARTAFLNGDVQVSRLAHIDFDSNSWWRLQGGAQAVRYTGISPGANAKAVLFYRPTWM